MGELIFVYQDRKQLGPYTRKRVEELVENGSLSPAALSWAEGLAEWIPLSSLLYGSRGELAIPPTASRNPPAPPTPTQPQGSVISVGPSGIGGWLLFFCVTLTLLQPLAFIVASKDNWEQARLGFEALPALRTAVWVDGVGLGALVVYGIVVGALVWAGDPSGRQHARRFLLIKAGGTLLVQILGMASATEVPREIWVAMWGGAFSVVFQAMLFSAAWWLYFAFSKRVRNTYSSPSR